MPAFTRIVRTRCLLTVILLALHASVTVAGPIEPLDVNDAAAPATLPADWRAAQTILAESFEDMPEGSHPYGWHFSPDNPYNQAPDHEVVAVRRTRDGGHVMHHRRNILHHWRSGITGGRMRLQFDFRPAPGAADELYFAVGIADAIQRADYALGSPTQHGPYVEVMWPGAAVASVDYMGNKTNIGKIDRNRWHRMVLLLNLDHNHYQVILDGKKTQKSIDFFNARWFREAEYLFFDSQNMLIDNLSVLHLPGSDPGVNQKQAMHPERRQIPALRMTAHPHLDGKVDDPAWESAWHTDRFFTPDGKPAQDAPTECWIGFLDDFLYLAMRVGLNDAAALRAAMSQAPKGELMPDMMDIFLDPSLGQEPHLHLMFDPAGNRNQIIDRPGWMRSPAPYRPPFPGRWDVATHLGQNKLTVEIRVPWSEVDAHFSRGNGLGAGTQWWGVNVLRGKALGAPAALAPYFRDPRNPMRFAKLAGLDHQITAAIECRLRIPPRIFTGPHTLRVEVARGGTLKTNDLIVQVTARATDGKQRRKKVPFERTDPTREQIVEVPFDIDREGGWEFNVDVRRTDGKGRSVGHSGAVYAHAVKYGTLEARCDRNYYTNEPTGRIRARLRGGELPSGSTATLSLQDASGMELHTKMQSVGGTSFTLDPFSVRELPLAEMTAWLVVNGPGGKEVARTSIPVVRRPAKHNEVKIRWDNVAIVDDKPFFPFFSYGSDVRAAVLWGANTVQSQSRFLYDDRPQRARKLPLMKSMGMKVISSEFGTDSIRGQVKDPQAMRSPILEDSTLLAFYCHDEPHATNDEFPTPEPGFRIRARQIREMDPYHPTFFLLVPEWKDTCAYAPLVDVIGHDPYTSYIGHNEQIVASSTRMLTAVTAGRQPIWQVLQSFFFKAAHEHPTPTDLRHSIWSAIVHGAHGIGFWGVTGSGLPGEDIRGMSANRANYRQARRTVTAVLDLAPVIQSEEPVDQAAEVDNEYVSVMSKRHEGMLYVFALNMRSAPEYVTLTLPVKSGRLVNELDPAGSWAVKDGRCKLTLDSLQPVVLRLGQ